MRSTRFFLVFVVLCGFLWSPAVNAQTVLLRVIDAETSQPIFGALAYLDDGQGSTVRNALTDERGRALFVGLAPGMYQVRAEMIGKGAGETEIFEVVAGATVARELRLESRALVLEGIQVEAEGGRCSVRPEQGLIIADVWDEARKALSAAAFTDGQEVYRYQTERYTRDVDPNTKITREEQRRRSSGYLRTPFESRPAEDLLENGFVQTDDDGDLYFAPDADVLLSDAFLDTHCLRLARGRESNDGLVGLEFEPVGNRNRVTDIAGTIWIDLDSYELRYLEYGYRNLNADLTAPDVGGRVDFRRLPNGNWIVPEWWIRMPTVGYVRDASGRRQPYLEAYRVMGGIVTEVQESGGRTVVRAETGTIEGIVLDSLGAEPLRGARVGVVGSPQSVFTNAEGRFAIPGLTEGTYQLHFSHARLEMMGYVPEPVVQEVVKGGVAAVRFMMPSITDIAFEACRDQVVDEGTSLLLGWVRDAATSRPMPGAAVQVRWEKVRMVNVGLENARITGETMSGFQVNADEEGRYRICGVPANELLTINTIMDGVELAGDTTSIDEFAAAKVYILEVVREERR